MSHLPWCPMDISWMSGFKYQYLDVQIRKLDISDVHGCPVDVFVLSENFSAHSCFICCGWLLPDWKVGNHPLTGNSRSYISKVPAFTHVFHIRTWERIWPWWKCISCQAERLGSCYSLSHGTTHQNIHLALWISYIPAQKQHQCIHHPLCYQM